MAKGKRPPQVPGAVNPAIPATEGTEANEDAALAAGQSGMTHKVEKPRAAVPPSPVAGDPHRRPRDPVNAKPSMSYAEAEAMLAAGTLKKAVLTEQGWVVPPGIMPPAQARA